MGLAAFQNLKPNTLIDGLIKVVTESLQDFPSSNEFLGNTRTKQNEDQFTSMWVLYMNNRFCPQFSFISQTSQKASFTVDVGVYKGSTLFFTIEAKVLPTPKSTKRNEHEYVYGKGSAIERFKNEKHGIGHDGALFRKNGILAYVKSETYNYWLSKINGWITDAGWKKDELLIKQEIGDTAHLYSSHTTLNHNDLELHHFWVKV